MNTKKYLKLGEVMFLFITEVNNSDKNDIKAAFRFVIIYGQKYSISLAQMYFCCYHSKLFKSLQYLWNRIALQFTLHMKKIFFSKIINKTEHLIKSVE